MNNKIKNKTIVLGVTGSIAAYKAADIIRRVRERGGRVMVIMTRAAEKFISPLTLENLSEEKVYCNLFRKKERGEIISHISLAQEADVLLIAPATANIIGKIANGLADDLLSCVALATSAKILIAPAMNTNMYLNKIVQKNIKTLKENGVSFIDPVKGQLACGRTGLGHLADVETIVKAVFSKGICG